ncbi:MAG: type II secretory ATPase GspE/PulE/Tfp pilus assembly ATPase PilB-like protein, partial [Candidatus Marinamargulisbacteria bacterium]
MSLFEAIEAIRDSGTITENSLCAELSKTEDIPFVQLSELTFDPQIEDRPKLKSLLDDRLIPIYESPSELGIATDSPYHPCLTTLSKTFEKPVQPYLINRPECNVYLSRKKQGRSAQDLTVLDTIFQMAVDRGASDIHVFQKARSADISLRIQGDLIPSFSISGDENSRLVSLLKYHSHMDISICNKPQDGRLTHQINNKDYDIRVATLPTTFGEDFACRIFGGQPARTLETL